MSARFKRITFDILLFAILLIADRASKSWAVSRLKDKDAIPIIRNIVEFHYLPNGNTGAAFGILSGHRILFLVIALIVVIVIAYLVFFMPQDKKYKCIEILLVFVAAGGVGNMIDRFVQNYVIDFIYISCINFPIFNVADMYVSVCTVILAVILLFRFRESDYEVFDEAFRSPIKRIFSKRTDK